MYNLACNYQEGVPGLVEIDLEKAFHYFKLSSDHGESLAHSEVAFAYFEGSGVKEDAFQAIRYFKKRMHDREVSEEMGKEEAEQDEIRSAEVSSALTSLHERVKRVCANCKRTLNIKMISRVKVKEEKKKEEEEEEEEVEVEENKDIEILDKPVASEFYSQFFPHCIRCDTSYYCTSNCQKDHWKNNHKAICYEAYTSKGFI